jgi:tRNA 2-thiocytidine biosynthesis protein TtcA
MWLGQRLPAVYNRRILRAILEFKLIDSGDKILVGFSGGKDSAFLLYSLAILRRHGIIKCDLGALTIDLGFVGKFPEDSLKKYCERLGVPFYLKRTEIGKVAQAGDRCNICSHLRRGAMNSFAREKGFNKVALAHHHDDAVETFLMSILYSGQNRTFLPKTQLDRSGLTVIRPLVYLREFEVRRATELTGFTPVPSPCPYNCNTQRQWVKELIASLTREHRWIYTNLAAAMRHSDKLELWPPALGPEMRSVMHFKPEKEPNGEDEDK